MTRPGENGATSSAQGVAERGATGVDNPARSGRRILVAEDDAVILRQIEFNLQNHGYVVDTAMTGVEAMRRLMTNRPDLLITDIMMPEMDGFELVASLRRDAELADLPVIMLTAKTLDSDIAQGYNSGTDLYLTKPFNPAELLSFVQRILG